MSWHSLRSMARSDKVKVPFDERPGDVYNVRCGRNASYIGETGNALLDTFKQQMANVGRLQKGRSTTERAANTRGRSTTRRGRPQSQEPQKIITQTSKGSAVVELSSQCSLDLQPAIICRENDLRLCHVKEDSHSE
ncbi:hypothetical protein M514_27926 [Trichuris suis]|nr:hypothetical protein M514_27926 [Trichuris suis]